MRLPIALVAVSVVLAGCVASPEAVTPSAAGAADGLATLQARASLPFVTDDMWSHTLVKGSFGILETPLDVYVDVAAPLGQGAPTQKAHMGVFLPVIPGCDWEAAELPDTCKVGVIADVGPYYADGDEDALSMDTRRLGGFLIQNFVPHGYAVAQVSVLGTGRSGGCMDLMGEMEQAGVQAAVEWLGTQPWSNGNVGLIGRSYDGSTPWEAAMVPSEHLKTIVPISGLGDGQYDLMWRNGSAELRGPGLLWGIYYTFTYSPYEHNGVGIPTPLGEQYVLPSTATAPTHARHIAENAICPDTQAGLAHMLQAYATGSPLPTGYFEERAFKAKVLENYKGSIYLIHGLQDWNVDPHAGVPFIEEYQAAGLEVKGLLGQWAHNYPDRLAEHEGCDGRDVCHAPESVRLDWAQDLLEWFDHYLKGTGPKPALHVEVQDYNGRWRVESAYPPKDATFTEFALGTDLAAKGSTNLVLPTSTPVFDGPGSDPLVFEGAPLATDLRLVGQPQLHLRATPMGPGGQLYAELWDQTEDRKVGHAVMDLRYAAGGAEMMPVVANMPLEVKMQFEPLDALVPAGHVLQLRIASTGMDYMPATTSAPVAVDSGVLRLPTVVRGEDAFFTTVLPTGEAKGPDGGA